MERTPADIYGSRVARLVEVFFDMPCLTYELGILSAGSRNYGVM